MALNALKKFGTILAFTALIFIVSCTGRPTTDAPNNAGTEPDALSAPANSNILTIDVPADTVKVVTTSNILADWVRVVGGDRVEIFPLLPPNSDLHTFQPGARDITRVADADLVFSVGLKLEAGWLNDLLENTARSPDSIVALGEFVDPIPFVETVEASGEHAGHEQGHEEGRERHDTDADGQDHGAFDPHFWFDPLRVKQAVTVISDQLSQLDPEGASRYRGNAAAYSLELDSLHGWITEEVANLPEDRRLLVTSHDSFQYFAQRYRFEIVGTVMPVTTDREPTAQKLAGVVETIRLQSVPAVFAEKSHGDRLARRVAEETGARLIGGLYTGSLGPPGGEAGVYTDLMRYNVSTIVEALR